MLAALISPKQLILTPHGFGMLLVGQGEGSEVKGLYRDLLWTGGAQPCPSRSPWSLRGLGETWKRWHPKMILLHMAAE